MSEPDETVDEARERMMVEEKHPLPMRKDEEEDYLLLAFTSVGGKAPTALELRLRSLDYRPLCKTLAQAGYYGGAGQARQALDDAAARLVEGGFANALNPEGGEGGEGKKAPEAILTLTGKGVDRALEVREREVR